MTIETNDNLTDHKPFWDSIKRIGEQARNWENITDFGADLDILKPDSRRRLAVSPKILFWGVGLISTFLILQTAFIYSELRAQRTAIEKLQLILQTAPKLHSKSSAK